MNLDPAQDKRQNKRYLCDEHFALCVIAMDGRQVETTAINFSQEGMGLFCSEHLPEAGSFKLTLSYDNPDLSKQFKDLPCSIVYCNQTEVGSHCGIRFEMERLSSEEKSSLSAIEQSLSQQDDPDDRYHLFGGD